jgi:hypothetical protein
MSRALAIDSGVKMTASGSEVNGQRREAAENVLVEIGAASSVLGLVVVGDHADGDRRMSLGADLFLQAVVDMDLDARKLKIINPKAFTPPSQAPLPVKLLKGVPTVQLKLNGQRSDVCAIIDTGYNSGLAVTQDVVNKLSLPVDPSGRRLVTRAAFGQQYDQPALAPLKELRLGDFIFRDVQVGHAPTESEQCVNLLGMAVLSQHRIVFDLQQKRIWLLPRSGIQ